MSLEAAVRPLFLSRLRARRWMHRLASLDTIGLKGKEADVLERNYCAPPARFQRASIAATP
jgi:hypothetical protein